MTLFHLSGLSVDVPSRRLLDDITLDLTEIFNSHNDEPEEDL